MFQRRAARWTRHIALQMVPALESEQAGARRQRRHPEATCSDFKLQDLLNKDINERSISPWKYK